MQPIAASITLAELAILVRSAGLDLNETQLADMHGVYGHLEAMLLRLRTSPAAPVRPRGAEPAHIFVPGQEWT